MYRATNKSDLDLSWGRRRQYRAFAFLWIVLFASGTPQRGFAQTLEVSIFDTLHKNDQRLDSSALLLDVMVIADEADLQLAEAMASFIGDAKTGTKPKDRPKFMAAL